MAEDTKSLDEKKSEYSAESIRVLEGIDAVRKRPAMYVGDTGIRGLHHLINEIVDNSIDEALAGYCSEIKVTLTKDGYCIVEDNGRGIPVDIHPVEKKPALEVVLTVLHAGGKFDSKAYKISGGLHGVGASVVNALSEHLVAVVKRGNRTYKMEFSRGRTIKTLEEIGTSTETGTIIKFKPDQEIFRQTFFERSIVEKRLRELAYLNAGLRITLVDERDSTQEVMQYTKGIVEFLESLEKKPLHKPIYIAAQNESLRLEVAFVFADRYSPLIYSYTNNINTIEGGTHTTGFRAAMTRAINEYAESHNFLKEINNDRFDGDDVFEGISAIISVMVPQPQFEGQTKTKLGNSEVRPFVETNVYSKFIQFLEENPSVARIIMSRCIQAYEARVAAQKAKELTRARKSLDSVLPGKLADCIQEDPDRAELFIVEGDSAGGTARQARNKEFQAILPLRGKILNVEKANLSKIFQNEEIQALVAAIGTGIQENFDINNRRYSKIVLMTDADVDGAHIRTLLLTFFYRYAKLLIEKGMVYIARPPLYRAKKGKFERYFYSDEELELFLRENREEFHIQRYKGLGEMNADQLWETTMNPESRTLVKVTIQDAEEAERLFTILMGEKVEPRKEFILAHAKEVTDLDI